ncbi:MAG: tetratricopeptide repeat protein [Candidatus Aminicenantes bacterium]|nr:tetratricopeptide repeat protein [Candidatus Aminicenantes bacterium]
MGKQEKAIELLTKAVSLLPPGEGLWARGRSCGHDRAYFLYPMALAFFRAGDMAIAQQEFEKINRLTFSRYLCGDLYAKSFYMLGQIHERLGNKKQARAKYLKFLDLWKNADPGIAEVDDARTRLGSLK